VPARIFAGPAAQIYAELGHNQNNKEEKEENVEFVHVTFKSSVKAITKIEKKKHIHKSLEYEFK
jgi:hypothetical protein